MCYIRRKRKLTVTFILILSLVFMFFLTSCFPTEELNKRGIIQSFGIDYKKGIFEVSFQIFDSSGSSSKSGESKSNNNSGIIVTSKGSTIMEAMDKSCLKQNKKIYYRIVNVIVLGRSVVTDKKVFKETIDFLNKTYMSNPNLYIIMSDETANSILTIENKSNSMLSNLMQDMLKNAEIQGYVQKVYLSNIVVSLNSINTSVSIPIVMKEKPDDEKEEKLKIKGIGILDKGIFKGIIQAQDVKYIQFLKDKKYQIDFNFLTDKFGRCDFNLIKKDIKIKSKIKNDKPHFDIELSIESNLMENDKGYNIRNLSDKDVTELESLQKDYLKSNITRILNKLLKTYNADLLYFTNNIYRSHYDFWLKHKDEWDDIISQINFSLNIKTHIYRSTIEKSTDH